MITGKGKLEEQWLGLGLGLEQFFVLCFSVFYFPCCIFMYYMYSLNSELTLKMQDIDVKQENTAQFRAEKKETKTKLQKTIEGKNWF